MNDASLPLKLLDVSSPSLPRVLRAHNLPAAPDAPETIDKGAVVLVGVVAARAVDVVRVRIVERRAGGVYVGELLDVPAHHSARPGDQYEFMAPNILALSGGHDE